MIHPKGLARHRRLFAALLVALLVACRQGDPGGGAAATSPPAPTPSAPAAPPPSPQPSASPAPLDEATAPPPQPQAPSATPSPAAVTLLVTNAAGSTVAFVEPGAGAVATVEVGPAPWGLTLAPNDRAYVATAEGVAVIDTRRRVRLDAIPYEVDVGPARYGEYRPGGMGIASSSDGQAVYVGVYLPDGGAQLAVLDVARRAWRGAVPVGQRPFQVLVSADDRAVYTIDHDTFTVTAVDVATLRPRTIEVAPLGNGGAASFDKPHYAVLRADGHLLLPYQGRTLVDLDPASGAQSTRPMQANTHQHGAALSPDGRRLLIVGTGAAGGATAGPRLSILDLETSDEQQIPLERPHERVALSPDGRLAYLTGGYTFANGGWDGITVVDLERRSATELPVPDQPLDIAVLP